MFRQWQANNEFLGRLNEEFPPRKRKKWYGIYPELRGILSTLGISPASKPQVLMPRFKWLDLGDLQSSLYNYETHDGATVFTWRAFAVLQSRRLWSFWRWRNHRVIPVPLSLGRIKGSKGSDPEKVIVANDTPFRINLLSLERPYLLFKRDRCLRLVLVAIRESSRYPDQASVRILGVERGHLTRLLEEARGLSAGS